MPGLPNSTKTSSLSTPDMNFPEITTTSELRQQQQVEDEEEEEDGIPLALAAITTADEEEKDHEEEENCVTPKSEEHVLKFPLTCPPAPRKPRAVAKRKFSIPARNLFVLPVDLASVFRALQYDPPKKKIQKL